LATVSTAFLLVLSLSAFADSNYDFHKEKLNGNSGSTLSGSFTFTGTASGGTFSDISLTFDGGVFAGINVSDAAGGKAKCAFGLCSFSWKTKVGNGWVWNTIVLNVNTGQFWDLGKIYNERNWWNFDPPLPAPEGGTELSYLMLSGLAVFAGILVSEKKRRTRTAASN
jgi:hypothetical protein